MPFTISPASQRTTDTEGSSAARFMELGEPLLIAKVDANQAWKDYTTTRATLEHGLRSENQDAHLITVFLPTLEKIVKAVTDKLDDFMIGSLLLPPSCQSQSGTIWGLISNNSNPDSPQYRQISLPPIKDYGYYGPSRFLPSRRAAPIAYNLTSPGESDDQQLNPSLWPERPPKDFPDGDPSFMLYVDFERSFLQLSLSSLEWMAETPKAEATWETAGSDHIFTGSQGTPVSDAEAARTLSDLISKFISDYTTTAQLEDLRVVALAGGASDRGVEVMRTALRSVSYLRTARMASNIDPAYVPALGGANWVVQRERLIWRDLQRKEEEQRSRYTDEL